MTRTRDVALFYVLTMLLVVAAVWAALVKRRHRLERNHMEGRLRLLAQALHCASDCICVTDTSDKILYVNNAFLRAYEFEEGELIGRHIGVVRALNNDPDLVAGILDATIRNGWRGDVQNRSKSGRVFPVSLATSVVHDDDGSVIATVGVARDMTKERATEDALRASREKVFKILESANDIVFTVDGNGRCLSMNRAGRTLTGYPSGDSLEFDLQDFVVPEQLTMLKLQLQRVLNGERVPRFELRVVNKMAKRLTLEIEFYLIQNGAGVVIQGIARDVTARLELEAKLRQAQKMEAIGRLAGGIAHDFNNMITVVLASAERVSEQLSSESSAREDLEAIYRAAHSANALTRQLLVFAQESVTRPSVIDLNEVIERLDRMLRLALGEHVEFIVRLGRETGLIHADPGQIEQVIMNLVINAKDAMPAGGTLTITTEMAAPDSVDVAYTQEPTTFVRLTVQDTGVGMTREVKEQIFTPFFTTKGPVKGTGLGLAIVNAVVEQARGFIRVDSTPGSGSTFAVYLPRTDRQVSG